MSDTTLHERLKEARFATATRRRSQVSQQLMATLVSGLVGREIHQTQWSLYELGKSEPPLDVIRAIADVSGLMPEYIAFGVTRANALVNRATGESNEPVTPLPLSALRPLEIYEPVGPEQAKAILSQPQRPGERLTGRDVLERTVAAHEEKTRKPPAAKKRGKQKRAKGQ
jgi:hypothetical protein